MPVFSDYSRAVWRLTGDEPAYLLTAQAIASGDGQNLRNVNEAQTYTRFQERPIIGSTQWTWDYYKSLNCKHWFDRTAHWGVRQTLARPPLISLIASPFAMRSSHVRWSICFAQSVLAALCACVLLLLVPVKPPYLRWSCAGITAVIIGSLPSSYYTCQIYPEVVTGLFLLLGLMLCVDSGESPYSMCRRWIGCAFMIIALWGTGRVGLGVICAASILGLRALRQMRVGELVVLSVGFMLYFGHNLWLWGYPIPPNPDLTSQIKLSAVPQGLLINFVSNRVGMFFLAPVTFTGCVCMVLLAIQRPSKYETWICISLFIGVAVVVASFPNWRAGTCPAGRYQVIQCFIILFAIIQWLIHGKGRWRARVYSSLMILGLMSLVISFAVMRWPSCWFEKYHPVFKYSCLIKRYWMLPDIHKMQYLGKFVPWFLFFAGSFFVMDAYELFSHFYKKYSGKMSESVSGE